MIELGVLKTVDGDNNIDLYHIHTMKTDEQKKWEIGDFLDTKDFLRTPSYNYPKRIREDAFEEIRSKDFNTLPSRKKCLFLSTSQETAKKWYNTLLGGDKQALKIKLIKGKYVILDEEIYENPEITDKIMYEDADLYWRGESIGCEKLTVLFEGIFKVESEISF